MAQSLFEAATLGGLDLGKGSGRKIVMFTGEITGFGASSTTGCLVNDVSGVSLADTSITVDTVDATTKVAVGDRLFNKSGLEIGTVTSVTTTTIGISAGAAATAADNDNLFIASEYDITADGTVTIGGGSTAGAAAADLVLTHGAGQIVVKASDLAATTLIDRGGIATTLEFTFGSSFSATNELNLIGAVGSFGWDSGGGTVGSATVDFGSFGGLKVVSGNKVEFDIALPYENEGGTQQFLADDAILKFCVIAITNDNGV